MKLNFKLLDGGILPTRAHKADAALICTHLLMQFFVAVQPVLN